MTATIHKGYWVDLKVPGFKVKRLFAETPEALDQEVHEYIEGVRQTAQKKATAHLKRQMGKVEAEYVQARSRVYGDGLT